MIVSCMPVLTSTPGTGHIYYDNACTLVEPTLTRMSINSIERIFRHTHEEQYSLLELPSG